MVITWVVAVVVVVVVTVVVLVCESYVSGMLFASFASVALCWVDCL